MYQTRSEGDRSNQEAFLSQFFDSSNTSSVFSKSFDLICIKIKAVQRFWYRAVKGSFIYWIDHPLICITTHFPVPYNFPWIFRPSFPRSKASQTKKLYFQNFRCKGYQPVNFIFIRHIWNFDHFFIHFFLIKNNDCSQWSNGNFKN